MLILSFLPVLVPTCAVLTLAAFSAAADSHDVIDLDQLTPWASELTVNDVDIAIVGNWRLIKGQVESSAGTIAFRSVGRILSIVDSGSFQEDYSTETNLPRPATDIVAGQVFGTGVDSYAPKSTCQIQATGLNVGDMRQQMEANLDADPPYVDAMTMRVRINMAAVIKPEVRCLGDAQLRGNMVTPPLGAGFARFDGDGPYVEYFYEISPLIDTATSEFLVDWYGLEIWSAPSPAPTVRYFFVRN